MVLLDDDFSDGDFLTAGVVSSTSSMNGITTTINSNTLTKLKHAGSDTEGSIASSTSEETLATVTIPANTFTTLALCFASIHFAVNSATATDGTFKLKTGVSSSETIRQTIILGARGSATQATIGGSMLWADTVIDFGVENVVIVTGQNANNRADIISTCYQLVVIGY